MNQENISNLRMCFWNAKNKMREDVHQSTSRENQTNSEKRKILKFSG